MRKSRSIAAATAVALCGLFVHQAAGQTKELRVLASNGVKSVIEALVPQCEQATGRHLAIQFNSSVALKQRIDAGEAFDVAIVTTDLLDTLIKEGKVQAASRAGIARAGVGVGIRAGAPKPDISTPDAMKRTLLNAKAITYAQDGASREPINKMFERFGITDAMKPKTILEQGSIRSTARVAQGDADLVMTLVSEILPIQGIELAGPLPEAVQSYVSFAAGIGSKTGDADAGKKLIGFLTGPSIAPTLKAKGLDGPPAGTK
jgi:molybdate transport system substrate-binding protein